MALTPALTRIRAFLEAGDTQYALKVLKATTYAWDDGADDLDDYFREYFGDTAGDFTIELGEYWAEAILSADISPDERREWAEMLDGAAIRPSTIYRCSIPGAATIGCIWR